jgi:hypothetical protein
MAVVMGFCISMFLKCKEFLSLACDLCCFLICSQSSKKKRVFEFKFDLWC